MLPNQLTPPSLLHTQSYITALEGYLDIMVRGRGVLDVLPNAGVLLLFAAGFFTLAIWRFRFE